MRSPDTTRTRNEAKIATLPSSIDVSHISPQESRRRFQESQATGNQMSSRKHETQGEALQKCVVDRFMEILRDQRMSSEDVCGGLNLDYVNEGFGSVD